MINCFFYFFTWFIKRGLIYDWPIEETGVTKIRFHDLRHTCATILLLNGAPVKAVSERPGHKRNTSNIYVLPSTSQQIADQMDGILN
ncbi:tyrosine-type recombinase/integrase [Bacillus sp. FSL M8-0256]|uniref:tyrosine-type recombinase/integrase n=1 Tax=Bacillus sp. FSL M8-0256 TaxID=2954578 RepID=UPI0030F5D876